MNSTYDHSKFDEEYETYDG